MHPAGAARLPAPLQRHGPRPRPRRAPLLAVAARGRVQRGERPLRLAAAAGQRAGRPADQVLCSPELGKR